MASADCNVASCEISEDCLFLIGNTIDQICLLTSSEKNKFIKFKIKKCFQIWRRLVRLLNLELPREMVKVVVLLIETL